MRTLIIPCAGKSTRFPNMKPKWLLTHPDGSLMIQKNVQSLNLDSFDKVIFTIVSEHDQVYNAKLILKQVFPNEKFQICILPHFTSGPAETIKQTIERMGIKGPIVAKDADNRVIFDDRHVGDFVVGFNIRKQEINRIHGKSFIILNEQNNVVDIIEKDIRSDTICLGVYGFESAADFLTNYKEYKDSISDQGEIYLSHILGYMIGLKKRVVSFIEADLFEDWGTLEDWQLVQKRHRTFFVDIDGVLLKNYGRYGEKNWSNTLEVLEQNMKIVKQLADDGAQVVFTTSRPPEYQPMLQKLFTDFHIQYHQIIFGLNHASRIVINDFASTNPYPSCEAISIPRDSNLGPYIEYYGKI